MECRKEEEGCIIFRRSKKVNEKMNRTITFDNVWGVTVRAYKWYLLGSPPSCMVLSFSLVIQRTEDERPTWMVNIRELNRSNILLQISQRRMNGLFIPHEYKSFVLIVAGTSLLSCNFFLLKMLVQTPPFLTFLCPLNVFNILLTRATRYFGASFVAASFYFLQCPRQRRPFFA